MQIQYFTKRFSGKARRRRLKRRLIISVMILGALLIFAAAWRWTALGQWLNLRILTQFGRDLEGHPFALLIVVGIYMTGSLLSIPMTVLEIPSLLVFGPFKGFIYALCGLFAAALITYKIGQRVGQELVRRMAGAHVKKASLYLARQGILTMLLVRLVPIAPFTIVNIIAGASHIHFWDYTIGSLTGMAIHLLAVTLVVVHVEKAVRAPSLASFAIVGGVLVIIGVGVLLVHLALLKYERLNN